MRQPKLLVTLGLTFAAVGTLVVASAPAAPTAANDLEVSMRLNRGFERSTPGPRFVLSFDFGTVSGSTTQIQTITMRFTLPDGLGWGPDEPDPEEGCTGLRSVTCRQELEVDSQGTAFGGWYWDVVAERPGTYEVTTIIETQLPDQNPANNSTTFSFEVRPWVTGGGTGSGGSSGGGGGSSAVSASAAKVTPAKPKAGSAVTASVRVSAGGSPVRPAGVACVGAIGALKLKGTPRAASGAASCTFRTPGAAKGKTLAGSVAFRAGGKRFSKRFSVRLG